MIIPAHFDRLYELDVLDRPPLIQPRITHVFPQRVEEVERGALHIIVRPHASEPWLGIFALGYNSPHVVSGVFHTADPNKFVAISGGYAFLADACVPEKTERLKFDPIVWAANGGSADLVLLANFRHVLAIDKDGIAWQTPALTSEGLTEVRIDGELLRGKGWSIATDTEYDWSVDLATGARIDCP